APKMFLNLFMRILPSSLLFDRTAFTGLHSIARSDPGNSGLTPAFDTSFWRGFGARPFGFRARRARFLRHRRPGGRLVRYTHRPVFPRPHEAGCLGTYLASELCFARRERGDIGGANGHCPYLIFGVARGKYRAEYAVANAGARDGHSMAHHQHHPMLAESACKRSALLRFDHQHIGVAEFIALVPERRANASDRPEVKNRHVIRTGGKQGHECRTMVVADRIHLRPGLVDFTMDHPFRVLADARIVQRLRVEVVFDEVVRRHEFGRAGARQQITIWIVGMPHADMPEGVNNAFIGDYSIGERKLFSGFDKCVGHGCSSQSVLTAPHYMTTQAVDQRARSLTDCVHLGRFPASWPPRRKSLSIA